MSISLVDISNEEINSCDSEMKFSKIIVIENSENVEIHIDEQWLSSKINNYLGYPNLIFQNNKNSVFYIHIKILKYLIIDSYDLNIVLVQSPIGPLEYFRCQRINTHWSKVPPFITTEICQDMIFHPSDNLEWWLIALNSSQIRCWSATGRKSQISTSMWPEKYYAYFNSIELKLIRIEQCTLATQHKDYNLSLINRQQ